MGFRAILGYPTGKPISNNGHVPLPAETAGRSWVIPSEPHQRNTMPAAKQDLPGLGRAPSKSIDAGMQGVRKLVWCCHNEWWTQHHIISRSWECASVSHYVGASHSKAIQGHPHGPKQEVLSGTWFHPAVQLFLVSPNPQTNGSGSIPIDTFLVGWTSIYQLFWGSLGTRVLTHPQMDLGLLLVYSSLINAQTLDMGHPSKSRKI